MKEDAKQREKLSEGEIVDWGKVRKKIKKKQRRRNMFSKTNDATSQVARTG